ncbi:MAG: hypothetical protein IT270_21655 [Saprospiraceae bacterium]|nr:hypothetical protein [Saprospiraceae bacterium]
MKKAILFATLLSCFLHTASAQKPIIYSMISFEGRGAVCDFGVTADKVPMEMQDRLKTSLKKKRAVIEVVTTMALEGWEYVDLFPNPSSIDNDAIILFRLRE